VTDAFNTLRVELGPRSYPIHIGPRLLGRGELLRSHIGGSQVMVVSNETVAPLYLEPLLRGLQGRRVDSVILPDGEQYKTLQTLEMVFDALMRHRHHRGTTLVALGGGVVGDLAGFAAACYQRGVGFIQAPTTLLAQVDSSVGGKTGVNHPLGKNMIGAFHQPRCVIADIRTLDTLDDRQLRAGLAEVIKYGLIDDPDFFDWLEANIDALLARDAAALAYAIRRSCTDKARIVAADEREAGSRALLNLGHTFGHAIETGVGYGSWLHGEAVATGMVLAAMLSSRMDWLAATECGRVERLLQRAGLPTAPPPELSAAHMLELMAVDKKVGEGGMRLVLLRGIGRALVTTEVEPAALDATLSGRPA